MNKLSIKVPDQPAYIEAVKAAVHLATLGCQTEITTMDGRVRIVVGSKTPSVFDIPMPPLEDAEDGVVDVENKWLK